MMSPEVLEVYYKRFNRYPAAYYEEPLLNLREKAVYNIFQEAISTIRYQGGPIPFDSICLLSEKYQIDFSVLNHIIRAIERAVVNLREKSDGK